MKRVSSDSESMVDAEDPSGGHPRPAHKIGPFIFQSEFPLPELPLAEPSEAPNVRVRYGPVPAALQTAITREPALEVSPREALLRISGVAQFLIRDGREVIIQPEPGALEADLRAYLAAAAFGVLCHQNGMLPLHASAIQSGSGAVAFLGDSGAGKSTLAAFLARRGYPVVSDDICLLDPRGSQTPLVIPVAPWMKLWRNTVEQLGQSAEALPRVFSDDDKYRVSAAGVSERLPLKQVLMLEWGVDDLIRIEPLNTVHAIQSMLDLVHQPYLIEGMGRARECFEVCGRALDGVKAFRFARPRGFEHIERVLDALEAHFAETRNNFNGEGQPA